MRYSYTKLSTYAQCPQKYQFYCQKALQESNRNIPLRFGKAVHLALEFAFKNKLNPPSTPQVIKYYKNLIKLEEDPIAIKRFKQAIPFLKQYLGKDNPKEISSVEVERKFVMNLDRDYKIERVVDRLDQLPDGSFEIIDYKTSSIGNAERLGDNWQLALY